MQFSCRGWEKPGVLLFNPVASEIDRQLPTKGDLVSSLALSPDDRLLAVGSRFRSVVGRRRSGHSRDLGYPPAKDYQNAESSRAIACIFARGAATGGRLQHRPDSGQPNREVYLWRYHETDSKPETLLGSAGRVAFSPSTGRLLITDARAMPPKVWDVATRRLLGVLQASSPTVAMAFSPNGGMFATAHDDGSIRLWDTSKQASLGILAQSTKSRLPALPFCMAEDASRRRKTLQPFESGTWRRKNLSLSTNQGMLHVR